MQDHIVNANTIFHDIPDMTSTPLAHLSLAISARHFSDGPERSRTLTPSGDTTPGGAAGTKAALAALLAALRAPREDMVFVEGLQILGAAFTQARALDTTPPGDMNQSQWNRTLRDQGERLRAASLTLGSGRSAVAALQLLDVVQFFEKHFHDLAK